MVTLAKIQGLDFETIEDYFEYIVDSRTNGNRQQAKELYNDLSAKQKTDFANWFDAFMHYEEPEEGELCECETKLSEMLKYLNN
jgi:hypothetical protein